MNGIKEIVLGEGTGWQWPHFELPEDIITAHNELARKNKGAQMTWTMSGKLKTLKLIVQSHNSGITKIKDGDGSIAPRNIEHSDMPNVLKGITRGFYGAVFGWIVNNLNYLQSTHTNLSSQVIGAGAGQAHQFPLIKQLISVCGLKATSTKKMTPAQKQAARQMPAELQTLLGIGFEDLLTKSQVKNIQLCESYLKLFYELHTEYNTLKNTYEYDGPIPREVVQIPDGEALPGWDEKVHTVNEGDY